MNNFNFYSPTYFAFGKDREQDVGALVKRFGGGSAPSGRSAPSGGSAPGGISAVPTNGFRNAVYFETVP